MSNSNSSSAAAGDPPMFNKPVNIASIAGNSPFIGVPAQQLPTGYYGGEPLPKPAGNVDAPFFARSEVRPQKIIRSTKPEQIIINPDYKDEVIVDTSHGYLEQPASRRLIRICKGEIKQCFLPNDGSAIDCNASPL